MARKSFIFDRNRNTPVAALLAASVLSLSLPLLARGSRPLFTPDGDGTGGGGGGGTSGGGNGGGGSAGDKGAGGKDDAQARVEAAERAVAEKDKELQRINSSIEELKKGQPSAADLAELKQLREDKAKAEKDKKAADEKRQKEEGRFEELLKNAKVEAETAIATERQQAETWKGKYKSTRVVNALTQAIAPHTRVPADQVIRALFPAGMVEVDETTDAIVFKNADGTTPKNKDGKNASFEEFVEIEIAKNPHFASFKPQGGSGGSGGGGGKKGSGEDGFTDDDIANMTQEEYEKNRAAIKAQLNKKPGMVAGRR